MQKWVILYQRASEKASLLHDIAPFLTRLAVGFVFAEAGYGKLQNLPKTVDFFRNLGIPAATVQAPMVACIELIGGIFLIVGLASRVVALPLIATMIVAILTALRSDIQGISDLFALSEFLFIVLLIWIVSDGPGAFSIDSWLAKKYGAQNAV